MNNIQNRVPVIDAEYRPLAPCSPRRARILIQQSKAHGRHRNGTYYLTLHRTIPRESIQSAHLMIDPGKSLTGLAIVRDDDEQPNRAILFCTTLQHRNDVRKTPDPACIIPRSRVTTAMQPPPSKAKTGCRHPLASVANLFITPTTKQLANTKRLVTRQTDPT